MDSAKLKSKLLRKYRTDNKLSREDFAIEAGVSAVTVKRAERGIAVSGEIVEKLAKFLKMAPADLIDDVEVDSESSPDAIKDARRVVREIHGDVRFRGLGRFDDERSRSLLDLNVIPQWADSQVRPEQFTPAGVCDVALHDLTPAAVKAWGKRVVVQAGPGYGKSNFVKFLALMLAARSRNEWRTTFADALPLPLILRDLGLTSAMDTWSALLQRITAAMPEFFSWITVERLAAELTAGRIVVLADGWDELPVAVRTAAHKALWEGMGKYPEATWILTSRIEGYEDVPLASVPEELAAKRAWQAERELKPMRIDDDDARTKREELPPPVFVTQPNAEPRPRTVCIAPFDNSRIQAFADHWYALREPTAKAAKGQADRFAADIGRQEGTRVLGRIPNLLTLMVLIHQNYAKLPEGRAELFANATTAYLQTIDALRGTDDNAFKLIPMRNWLADIAFSMQSERDGGETNGLSLSREEFISRAIAAMQRSQHPATKQSAKNFLTRLLERSGLIVDKLDGQVGFIHLSFQDYFAALYLRKRVPVAVANQSAEQKAFLGQLQKNVERSYWNETFLLLFQVLYLEDHADDHRTIRHPILGASWEDGDNLNQLKGNRLTLLLELAANDYTGYDWPCVRSQGRVPKTLRQRLREDVTTLFLLDSGFRNLHLLSHFTALTTLNLGNNQISDDGLVHLRPLTALTTLFLDNNQISDDGLVHLRPLTALTKLFLVGNQVSNRGIRNIERAIPGISIIT